MYRSLQFLCYLKLLKMTDKDAMIPHCKCLNEVGQTEGTL